MTTKRTTWNNETDGVVQILDGPAAGSYPVHSWSTVAGGLISLGRHEVAGRPVILYVREDEIEGFTAHRQAYLAEIAARPAHCEKCGVELSRSAYHQQEHARFGGQLVAVTAYYCDACHRLLASIGTGEQTDLQGRAEYRPSHEPDYKGEQ